MPFDPSHKDLPLNCGLANRKTHNPLPRPSFPVCSEAASHCLRSIPTKNALSYQIFFSEYGTGRERGRPLSWERYSTENEVIPHPLPAWPPHLIPSPFPKENCRTAMSPPPLPKTEKPTAHPNRFPAVLLHNPLS